MMKWRELEGRDLFDWYFDWSSRPINWLLRWSGVSNANWWLLALIWSFVVVPTIVGCLIWFLVK